MKNRSSYLILLFLGLLNHGFSQAFQYSLSKAGACFYRNSIYVFGLRSAEKNTWLKVYRLNDKLQPSDSSQVDLNTDKPDIYLTCWADTIHGNLNIYTQRKDRQKVQINRFDSRFKLRSVIKDVEVTRLNNFSAFEKQIYRHEKEAYTIRITNDSTGKLFFLNKYKLKSDTTNYEYEEEWQFPFERRFVNSCRIVHVDNHSIVMYANVTDGDKRGQWILKVNKANGKLIKGTRLNDRGQTDFYAFGHIIKDTLIKGHLVFGVHYLPAELDQKAGKLNAAGKKTIDLFIAAIDSSGNLLSRSEFTVPVVESKGVVYKTPVHYIQIITASVSDPPGNIRLYVDLYKAQNNNLCFTYAQSMILKLNQNGEDLIMERSQAGTNPMLEKYFLSTDQLNMNGKLCSDSLMNFENIFFTSPSLPVKIGFRTDEQNDPIWLLKKSDVKKNTDDFSILSPVNKIYKVNKLLEVKKTEEPFHITLSKQLLIFRQSAEDIFQINSFNW